MRSSAWTPWVEGWYADGGMMIAVVFCRQRLSSFELFDVL
jgi:hypothetical protein